MAALCVSVRVCFKMAGQIGFEVADLTVQLRDQRQECARHRARPALRTPATTKSERYRARFCARCALRDDLHAILEFDNEDIALDALLQALGATNRPQSAVILMRGARASPAAAERQRLGSSQHSAEAGRV